MFNCNQTYDLKSAGKLCDLLEIGAAANGRMLDIDAGTGVLVHEFWSRGMDAYGVGLTPMAHGYCVDRIYWGRQLNDVHFPTDHFQWAIALDVPDDHRSMIGTLQELFRITDQGGEALIGLPLVFYQEGQAQMDRIGFTALKEIERDDQRAYFRAKKPEQKRRTLLLPPGVGDIYWPLVKTQALLRREGVESPVDVYVAAPRAKKYNSEARSFPFLEMFPFLHSTGEVRFGRGPIHQGRTVFRNVHDCDYFITWNGHLRAGKTLEEVDPDLACNWHLPRFVSLGEEHSRHNTFNKYGKYLVLYWSFSGTNRQMLRHFTLEQIAEAIKAVVDRTKLRPVLVGGVWDLDCQYLNTLARMLPSETVDLRGKTTLEEVFGIMRGAEVVLGMNSGITVMAAAFKVKTVMLIHDYLFTNGVHRNFAWNTVPPNVRRKTYFAEYADQTTPEGLVERTISLINDIPASRLLTRRPGGTHRIIKDSGPAMPSIRDLDSKPLVTCVLRAGGDFNARYVINLKNMIDRNLTGPYRFVCLTDLPVIAGIETVGLETDFPGWWAKLELFRPGLFDGHDRAVYFDLDTLILGNIDRFFYLDDGFHGLRPWNLANRAKGQTASGVMVWEPGRFDFIYTGFSPGIAENGNTDQGYITKALRRQGIAWKALQDEINGIHSYKRECRAGLPSGARVVCFHGRPRVHECQDKWVVEAWR
jgi:hypothetical protein